MSADELDVDAELLAMAGDSSDDESDAGDLGEVIDDTQVMDGPRTPSEEPKPSVEKVVEEAPSVRRGVAQKVRKNRRKRDRRREIEDELDDLGDGSPSPPASIGSGAMSESPGAADAPGSPGDIDDGPLYPLEGKFVSATDRDHILGLPEIERESILADRAQQVLQRQQDLQLKKALAASQAAASKRKRKVTAAELDEDGARKTSRPKMEKGGKSALDDYKKAREAKGAERTSRFDSRRDRRRSRSASSASDRDADGESEVEWAEPSSSRRDKDEPPAELRDFDRCRIGRTAFAKVCFYPNFEETMKGCFCRVSIGVNRETGQNMYRMTQIKGFTPGKPYALETSQGKTFLTDQYALVAHGSAEKPWPFSACSDSSFTESEFQRYKETLEKERTRMPKRNWLMQKLDDLHRFLNVQWTDEVLQGKFARQREMERRVDPAKAVKVKREGIIKRKAQAEEIGDEEEVTRCEAELSALGVTDVSSSAPAGVNGATTTTTAAAAKPIKSSPLKATTGSGAHTQQERLALLNQKNRGKNADDVRRALLEERKKLQREREKALAEAKAKAEAAAAEAERKKAEAALLGVPGRSDFSELFGDISDMSRAGTPMSGVSTPRMRRSRAGTPMNGVAGPKKEKSGLGLVVGVGDKKKKAEDELGGLDLGIDVEI